MPSNWQMLPIRSECSFNIDLRMPRLGTSGLQSTRYWNRWKFGARSSTNKFDTRLMGAPLVPTDRHPLTAECGTLLLLCFYMPSGERARGLKTQLTVKLKACHTSSLEKLLLLLLFFLKLKLLLLCENNVLSLSSHSPRHGQATSDTSSSDAAFRVNIYTKLRFPFVDFAPLHALLYRLALETYCETMGDFNFRLAVSLI